MQNFSGPKSGVNQEKFSTKAAQRRSFEKRFHENRQKSPRDLLEKIPRDKNGVNEVSIIEFKKYKYVYKFQWIDGALFEDF